MTSLWSPMACPLIWKPSVILLFLMNSGYIQDILPSKTLLLVNFKLSHLLPVVIIVEFKKIKWSLVLCTERHTKLIVKDKNWQTCSPIVTFLFHIKSCLFRLFFHLPRCILKHLTPEKYCQTNLYTALYSGYKSYWMMSRKDSSPVAAILKGKGLV